jgi:hypothetical protein
MLCKKSWPSTPRCANLHQTSIPPFRISGCLRTKRKRLLPVYKEDRKDYTETTIFGVRRRPLLRGAEGSTWGGRCSCCQCVRSFHSRPTLPRSVTHRLWDKWATLVSEHHLRGRKTILEGGGILEFQDSLLELLRVQSPDGEIFSTNCLTALTAASAWSSLLWL